MPSAYLAEIAGGWGLDRSRLTVLPNPAPAVADVALAPQPSGTFTFVGRLTRQKALEVAFAAVASVPEARLVVIGDGPDRERLEAAARDSGAGDRIELRGALPRLERAGGRRGLDGCASDERLGELPALGGRGSRGRSAGSLDRRGRGAGDRA